MVGKVRKNDAGIIFGTANHAFPICRETSGRVRDCTGQITRYGIAYPNEG